MKTILAVFLTVLALTHLHSNNITWSNSPIMLSSTNYNASDPHITMDPQGDVAAVWIENNIVKSSSKPANGNWSSEVTLSAAGASSPRVVSDQNGNATAIWIETGVVKAAVRPFNGNWSASTALSNNGAASPTLCVDLAGDIVAAWVSNGKVESATKIFGMNWQGKQSLNSNNAASPCIAAGGSGSNTRFVIAWVGTAGGSNTTPLVYSSSKLLSGNWSSGQVISESVHNAAQPSVAVDSNGNALALWYEYDLKGVSYNNVTVKSAGSPAAGTWTAVSSLSLPGIRNPSTLSAKVAFDSIGNAIALWNISYDDETFNIESSVYPVNGNWSPVVELATSNLYAYSNELSVTSFGDVLSLYLFYNGASLLIQSIESDINGFLNNSWSVPVTISNGTENSNPKIAAAISGNVIHTAAVWINNNGTHNVIVASTGSKTLVLPPSGLSVTQSSHNFSVFTEYYNTLHWTASTDPNVVGYLIFRNGTFIAQVGASVTSFIDDNRVQNGAVTYSVTAVDNQQTQSTTVSVTYE